MNCLSYSLDCLRASVPHKQFFGVQVSTQALKLQRILPHVSSRSGPVLFSNQSLKSQRNVSKRQRKSIHWAYQATSAALAVDPLEELESGAEDSLPTTSTASTTSPPLEALGYIPHSRQVVVCDEATLALARSVVLEGGQKFPGPAGHLHLVGLDCEWRPFERNEAPNPVSILQVVTRTHAFLIDMLYWCEWYEDEDPASNPGPAQAASVTEGEQQRDAEANKPERVLTEKEVQMNQFLEDLFTSKSITRVGFQFGYDIYRMRRSYPHLPVFRLGGVLNPQAEVYPSHLVVEVLKLARKVTKKIARRRPIPLKELHRKVLKTPIDKTQQCSDWAQRPLTKEQMEYASADGLSVVRILDTLADQYPRVTSLIGDVSTSTRPFVPRRPPSIATRRSGGRGGRKAATRRLRQSIRVPQPGDKLSGRHAVVCTPLDVVVDIDGLIESQLGKLASAIGQQAIIKQVANATKIKFPKNNNGTVQFQNMLLVFAELGKINSGRSISKTRFLNDGTCISGLPGPEGSKTGAEERVLPTVLFCRAHRSAYMCLGRVTREDTSEGGQQDSDLWRLEDYHELQASEYFQGIVKSTSKSN